MRSALSAALKFHAGALYEEAEALDDAARSWIYLNEPRRDVAAHLTDAAEALRRAAQVIGAQR